MQRPSQQDDDTVNAAAIVLAAPASTNDTGHLHLRQRLDDDHHTSCAATEKTRWWSRLKARLACFRLHGYPQRISAASPEPAAASAEQAAGNSSSLFQYTGHAPQPAVAFVAPPPSPASSALTSESPSPVVLLNANISTYSSPTASIFAVGPYAREPQQLVSPPAFSAGLTEPSTAPLTPPAEPSSSCSPHLLATTPSSPEVPFARFLWPSAAAADHHQRESRSGGGAEGLLLLHAYQLQPGSPVLVSPGSTSSSPPSWAMQHLVRARSEGLPLLDGGRVAVAEEGGDRGSGGARMNDGEHEDDEVAKSGGDFVFGNNSDAAACGEVAGGGASLALGDATEQWPFHLAHG